MKQREDTQPAVPISSNPSSSGWLKSRKRKMYAMGRGPIKQRKPLGELPEKYEKLYYCSCAGYIHLSKNNRTSKSAKEAAVLE